MVAQEKRRNLEVSLLRFYDNPRENESFLEVLVLRSIIAQ